MTNILNKINTKVQTYLCICLIGVVFAFNYGKIFDYKPDLNGDNVYYYALGKALAEGKGYTNIMGFEESPHTHFPPGYPLFTASVLSIFHSYVSLKMANGVLFFLAILFLFLFIRKISDSILLALGSCLLCCMQPELLRYSTIVMSEMLFTCLSIAALYLLSLLHTDNLFGGNRPRSQIFLFILLIICLNYIYFVRTMGTSIILAFMIYFSISCIQRIITYIWEKRQNENPDLTATNKRIVVSNVLVLVILVGSFSCSKIGWDMRNRSHGVVHSDYLNDFKKKPKGEQMATFSDWAIRIQNNITSYSVKWIPSAIWPFDYDRQKTNSTAWARGFCVIALIIFGLSRLKKYRLLLSLYLGITMTVLLFWPEQYAGHRYMIGIIPLLIFLFLNGCVSLVAYLLASYPNFKYKYKELIPTGALVLFIVFFMFPKYSQALETQRKLASFKVWNERIAPEAFIEYVYAIQWCKKNLPEDARIACRKPELFYLFSSGRKAVSFPQYGKPEVIFNNFKKDGITHVIIDRWFRHGYVTIYPLAAKYYPEYFKPIVQFGKNTDKQLPTLLFEFHPEGVTPIDENAQK